MAEASVGGRAVKPVVVGVDGSDSAVSALRWAVDDATRRGLPVRAVLAWGADGRPWAVDERAGDQGTSLEAAAGALLDDTVGGVAPGETAVPVERLLVDAPPVEALLREAEDAAMLVVGARGLGRVARLLVGSVSQACLDHATVPVVIVRARAASAGPRDGGASAATTGADRSGDPDAAVVVGVDGSDPSIRALRFAADEAALRGVPLRVLHAWPLVAAPYVAEYPGDGVEPEEAARQVLDRTVHSGLGGRRDIEVRAELAHGPAVRILLEESAGASLLVVGSRGRGGFAELLLGSTSHQVASHASCPVAVVRGPEATDGGGRS